MTSITKIGVRKAGDMLKNDAFKSWQKINFIRSISQNTRSFNSIPRPLQLPFFGNWHLYKFGIYDGEKYHRVLCHMYEKYGPIVYERIGPRTPIVHVFEPRDVETVYRHEDKTPTIFPLSEITRDYRKQEAMSVGLGNTNDDDWYRMVTAIRRSMLRASNVRQFMGIANAVTDKLIGVLKRVRDREGHIPHLRTLLGKWSQEVAGEICFGIKLGYLDGMNEQLGERIVQANATAFRLGTDMKFSLPFYKYWPTPKMNEFIENENLVHRTAAKYTLMTLSKIRKQEQQNPKENEEKKTNNNYSDNYSNNDRFLFLQTLLQEKELSLEDIIIIATSLFIDGLSTTVPVLINNLYALAVNQRVQDEAYEEICRIFAYRQNNKNNNDEVTFAIVDQLHYLKAVIKETFRMYPNGTEVARINKKPLILSDYYIPTQTHLSLNLLVHFKSEEYFSDPKVFKPERWLRASDNVSALSEFNPFLLTPFGYGARTCVGRKFAEQDLLISLYKILKNFRLTYPPDAPPIDFVFHTLLFPDPKIHLPISFEKRTT